jgi:hypothetical protein
MKTHLCYIFLLFSIYTKAQNNHPYVLKLATTYFDAVKSPIKGGDTLYIEGGIRKYLQLKNLRGDSSNPIVIINKGLVEIHNSDFYYGFKVHNCQYIKLTGTGDPQHKYGFTITKTGPKAPGLNVTGITTDIEIDHFEISGAGFAGVMSKSDPACDHSTNRESFTQKNIQFHHNYIHDVGGEGFYIGSSFYQGFDKSKKCHGDTLYPHEIWNLKIYNNLIENTAWEGIQIGCATRNTQVFNNRIFNFGLTNKPGQNNGLQIGEGTSGIFHNNIISNGNGNGIIILGQDEILIYNNYISNCTASGIFCDNRTICDNPIIAVFNNTIDSFGLNAIRWFNETSRNIFANNLLINSNPKEREYFIFHPQDLKQESLNNLTGKTRQSLNLIVNPDGDIECQTQSENSEIHNYLRQVLNKYNIMIHDKMGAYLKKEQFK